MENKSLYTFNELAYETQLKVFYSTGLSYEALSEDSDALYDNTGNLITYI